MDFFRFNRKNEAENRLPADIPFFASLTPSELRQIEKCARFVEYRRGDIVYRQGQSADAFYIVIAGRFRVSAAAQPSGTESTLFYAYRGEHFGEISILNDLPHSVTVEAKRDGILLRIEKEDFKVLARDIPAVVVYLNRSLGHRLTRRAKNAREVRIGTLIAREGEPDTVEFISDLCAALVKETKSSVVLIDLNARGGRAVPRGIPAEKMQPFALSEGPQEGRFRSVPYLSGYAYVNIDIREAEAHDEHPLRRILAHFTEHFDHVMIRAEAMPDPLLKAVLQDTDTIYLFADQDFGELRKMSFSLQKFQEEYKFSPSDIRVLARWADASSVARMAEIEKRISFRISNVVPDAAQEPARYHRAVHYLARDFAGKLIGLALGSGAAYGLAHIGILRVLERENIPVDIVAGSSIGAFLGAFWASGIEADRLEEIACSLDSQRAAFAKLIGFRDLSFFVRGVIKGRQMVKFMERYLGNTTFQDLRTPVLVTATRLASAEEVIFERGRVVDALRASISIPGVFEPVRYHDQEYIDGGIVDPLPVSPLRRRGVKKIIAVNVLANYKERQRIAETDAASQYRELRTIAHHPRLARWIEGARFRMKKQKDTSLLTVIGNAILFMEYELAQLAGQDADIYLHPDVPDAHWTEFHQAKKFIQAGESVARKRLEEIRQLVLE
ncbi:MAG: patatin-like phospholipase family protein [Candidatus Omnitrophota bacterium]